jgi:DNA-binding MarR family transcriptional regulator
MFNSDSIVGLLMRVMHLHMMYNYAHMDDRPMMHPAQIRIMAWIGEHEGCTQAEISQHLLTKPSTVAISIRRLEKAGHVRRERDQTDQRIWRVYLTEMAQAFKQRMHAMIEQEEKIILYGLSEADTALLRSCLERIARNLASDIHAQGGPSCEEN